MEVAKIYKFIYTDYTVYQQIIKTNTGLNDIKELEEKIIGKREESNMVMENLRRIIREDREEARQEGRREGIKQVVKRMLKNKMKIDIIKKMTNIDDKELNKIKKEMENKNFI